MDVCEARRQVCGSGTRSVACSTGEVSGRGRDVWSRRWVWKGNAVVEEEGYMDGEGEHRGRWNSWEWCVEERHCVKKGRRCSSGTDVRMGKGF